MIGLGLKSGVPTRIYNRMDITPPNTVILPGDPVQINNNALFSVTPSYLQVQVGTIVMNLVGQGEDQEGRQ